MRNRTWLVAAVLVVVIAVAGGVALGSQRDNRGSATPVAGGRAFPRGGTSVIPVDVLAGSPDQHLGRVAVAGSVTSVDAASHSLVLGCADACVAVPVKFSGSLPQPGANVVVQGTIGKNGDGKYAFVATAVKAR